MKGSNLGAMPENPKQKKGFVFGGNAEEPDIKKDQIWARCRRTQNKKKGSNSGMMSENPKQNEGIESRRDIGEPEIKGRE